MRIKCPECESVLSLGQPKPGSYRPKCKHCGKAFRLKVTDDDPPKVGVGRLSQDKSRTNKKRANPEATTGDAAPSNSTVEATVDSAVESAVGKPAASENDGVEATLDQATVEQPALDQATVEQPALDQATVDQATVDQATVDQATVDQATLDPSTGAGAANSSSVASRQQRPASQGDPGVTVGAADETAGNVDATVDGTVVEESKRVASKAGRSAKPLVSAGASSGRSASRQVSASRGGDVAEVPERLGGYRVLRLLGRGAMGAVYEAKQVSLDRLVALKTIRDRLANNPASLARFVREAYAAAQLTHHNVVQIYDFGEDAGRHFFSMEWVRGGPLDELIREKGALDPKLAAGYTLQAARGLQFAHRNGMVHRDVKPANLLLSDEGVIKVADLGLVKIPDQADTDSDAGITSMSGLESGTQVTMQGTAVGTPAYMAPEQGIDAAAVDHRADIYSLGCTLFYMLVGRPPFDGTVVSEVLQQHAQQPLPSLRSISTRVPEPLERIVERAMAKRPEDRYASLSEMIAALESFLGYSDEGQFSPTVAQADRWESIASRYRSAAPLIRMTKPLFAALVAVSGLLTVLLPVVAGFGWLLFGPVLFLATVGTALILGARGGRSALVTSLRGWIGSLSWVDYLVAIIGACVLLLVVLISGLWPGFFVGLLLGAITGAAFHFALIAPSRGSRASILDEAERFIRDLRIEGADEEGVRSFAARYGGKGWQPLFEDLFGYPSLCTMRTKLKGDPSFSASTSANSWRDKICAALDSKARVNRDARDHKRLAKIEQHGLQSEGLSADEARDRAWQMAAAVMDNAREVSTSTADAQAAAEEKRARMKAMLADARSGKYKKKRDPLAPIRFALGGQTRLLAGCILLAIFALWGNSSGLFESFKNIQSADLGEVSTALRGAAAAAGETESDTQLLGTSPWSVGWAGLLLVMSAFVSGWRMTPFAAVATIVILFGPMFGIPGVASLLEPWMVAALSGLAVYVPGVLFGEAKEF